MPRLAHALEAAARGGLAERVLYVWGEPGAGKTHLLKAFAGAARGARYVAARILRRGGRHGRARAGRRASAWPSPSRSRSSTPSTRAPSTSCWWPRASAPRDVALRRDLATRLATGLTYRVLPLTDEEKRAALAAHARARGFALADEVSGLPAHARAPRHGLAHGRARLPRPLLARDRAADHRAAAEGRAWPLNPREARPLRPRQHAARGDSDYAWAQFLIEEGVLARRPSTTRGTTGSTSTTRTARSTSTSSSTSSSRPSPGVPREQLDAWHARLHAAQDPPDHPARRRPSSSRATPARSRRS